MPSLDLLLPFIVATAVFAFVPGPGMFYAAAQTIVHGNRAGWLSAVGLHIGGYVHVAAAAFGLALLLKTVPILYAVVKFAGAAYLIWLGIRFFTTPADFDMSAVTIKVKPRRIAIRDSILVEILNPKTAIFYLAFLPQFTDPAAAMPLWGQILILGVLVNVAFSMTDILCVLLSDMMAKRLLASQWANRMARRVGGGILVALGINLAASQR